MVMHTGNKLKELDFKIKLNGIEIKNLSVVFKWVILTAALKFSLKAKKSSHIQAAAASTQDLHLSVKMLICGKKKDKAGRLDSFIEQTARFIWLTAFIYQVCAMLLTLNLGSIKLAVRFKVEASEQVKTSYCSSEQSFLSVGKLLDIIHPFQVSIKPSGIRGGNTVVGFKFRF